MKTAQFGDIIQRCCPAWESNEDCLIKTRDRLKSPAV